MSQQDIRTPPRNVYRFFPKSLPPYFDRPRVGKKWSRSTPACPVFFWTEACFIGPVKERKKENAFIKTCRYMYWRDKANDPTWNCSPRCTHMLVDKAFLDQSYFLFSSTFHPFLIYPFENVDGERRWKDGFLDLIWRAYRLAHLRIAEIRTVCIRRKQTLEMAKYLWNSSNAFWKVLCWDFWAEWRRDIVEGNVIL